VPGPKSIDDAFCTITRSGTAFVQEGNFPVSLDQFRKLRYAVFAIRQATVAGRYTGETMRRTWVLVAALAAVILGSSAAVAQQSTMPPDAKVYILWPPDGQVIKGGFWIRMGLSGAGIAPAGVQKANTGHHHLIIDADLPPLDQPIPNDHNHLHFGLGQTEARLDLPPGRHTLQLLLGDENHIPHQPPLYSKRITITVVQ
jgi:hypothetical protein